MDDSLEPILAIYMNRSEVEPRFEGREEAMVGALESVRRMMGSASGDRPLFPPTLLYNEAWLLRQFLDWFAGHSLQDYPLSFAAGCITN